MRYRGWAGPELDNFSSMSRNGTMDGANPGRLPHVSVALHLSVSARGGHGQLQCHIGATLRFRSATVATALVPPVLTRRATKTDVASERHAQRLIAARQTSEKNREERKLPPVKYTPAQKPPEPPLEEFSGPQLLFVHFIPPSLRAAGKEKVPWIVHGTAAPIVCREATHVSFRGVRGFETYEGTAPEQACSCMIAQHHLRGTGCVRWEDGLAIIENCETACAETQTSPPTLSHDAQIQTDAPPRSTAFTPRGTTPRGMTMTPRATSSTPRAASSSSFVLGRPPRAVPSRSSNGRGEANGRREANGREGEGLDLSTPMASSPPLPPPPPPPPPPRSLPPPSLLAQYNCCEEGPLHAAGPHPPTTDANTAVRMNASMGTSTGVAVEHTEAAPDINAPDVDVPDIDMLRAQLLGAAAMVARLQSKIAAHEQHETMKPNRSLNPNSATPSPAPAPAAAPIAATARSTRSPRASGGHTGCHGGGHGGSHAGGVRPLKPSQPSRRPKASAAAAERAATDRTAHSAAAALPRSLVAAERAGAARRAGLEPLATWVHA